MFPEMIRNAYYRLPDGIQRAILVKRRERIWIEAGIVFIHIPKAAGTSISEALYGSFMGHVRASDVRRWGSAQVNALPSFAVTRNPWDRLVSAYRFTKRLLEKDWKTGAHIPPAVRAQIPDVESFEAFVRDWLAHRDVRRLNLIFRPQSQFVCDSGGNLLVDHLGRVEDIGATYEFLESYVAGLGPMKRENVSGAPVDYRQFYTPRLKELVERIYADDVQRLGYDF
jgi:hypothetical protein